MKEIKLLHGKIALVDDSDFERVSKYHWIYYRDGKKEYVMAYENYKAIRLHRLVMNAPKGFEVDHINHDGLDNRRSNLRVCTRMENLRNRKLHKNNTSGFKGVTITKRDGKIVSRIGVKGKRRYLGEFGTLVEAARAYDNAAKLWNERRA